MKTLTELQSANLPKATLEMVGISISGKDGDTRAAEDAIKAIKDYLSHFVHSDKCLKCNAPVGGLLGRFEYGLVYGEGHCYECHYPMRAQHDIKGFGKMNNIVLQYHPDELTEVGRVTEDSE